MIPFAAGARVWIATGHTDMRRGMVTARVQARDALAQKAVVVAEKDAAASSQRWEPPRRDFGDAISIAENLRIPVGGCCPAARLWSALLRSQAEPERFLQGRPDRPHL